MVCFGIKGFRLLSKLFPPRKEDRTVDISPPPYEHQPTVNSECVAEKCGSPFLNPNLSFTASDLEAHLVSKDAKFAAAVVELMVPRLKLGVWKEPVGWGHYSYSLDRVRSLEMRVYLMIKKKETSGCHSDACQCNKATGWDSIIGFKAWDYSSRFPQVSELVKRDLELRGFAVDKVEVYTHKCTLKNCRGGVFVKWEVSFPGVTAEGISNTDLHLS
jgi:hypothetical protein